MPERILEPGRTEQNYRRPRWRDRELCDCLARRDILVRYKPAVRGLAWA